MRKIVDGKTVPLTNSSSHTNAHYISEIINTTKGSGTVLVAAPQPSNSSRNPVIQQTIVQPTQLLPVLPIPTMKQDPPKETPNITSKLWPRQW